VCEVVNTSTTSLAQVLKSSMSFLNVAVNSVAVRLRFAELVLLRIGVWLSASA